MLNRVGAGVARNNEALWYFNIENTFIQILNRHLIFKERNIIHADSGKEDFVSAIEERGKSDE